MLCDQGLRLLHSSWQSVHKETHEFPARLEWAALPAHAHITIQSSHFYVGCFDIGFGLARLQDLLHPGNIGFLLTQRLTVPLIGSEGMAYFHLGIHRALIRVRRKLYFGAIRGSTMALLPFGSQPWLKP